MTYLYTLHPHERQRVDGYFRPGMHAGYLRERDDFGSWKIYRERPDLVEMRHYNGAVMRVTIVGNRAMSYELLEGDAAQKAEAEWKAFVATGQRDSRERAVLSRNQLRAHREWLRQGNGDHFDLRDKKYEEQAAVGWTFENGTILSCAFIRCNLSSAAFRGATLSECLFDAGSLEMAKFHGATVSNCVLDNVAAVGVFVDDAHFTGCTFRQGTLATVTWRGAVISRCRFEGTVLKKSRLLDVEFADCTFVGCDFSDTDWQGVDVSRAVFESCPHGPHA